MAARKKRRAPVEEPEQRSAAAGGCVLVVLGAVPLAVVWAVSAEAGVLAVWVAGVAAVWWSARRRVSDSSATPPTPSGATVYAGETGEIERVQEGPGEGLTILYPVRFEAAPD